MTAFTIVAPTDQRSPSHEAYKLYLDAASLVASRVYKHRQKFADMRVFRIQPEEMHRHWGILKVFGESCENTGKFVPIYYAASPRGVDLSSFEGYKAKRIRTSRKLYEYVKVV